MSHTSEAIEIDGTIVKIATGTRGDGELGNTQTVNVCDVDNIEGNYRERYRLVIPENAVTIAEIRQSAKTLNALDKFLTEQKGAKRLGPQTKTRRPATASPGLMPSTHNSLRGAGPAEDERNMELLLDDNRSITFSRISSQQLSSKFNFGSDSEHPMVITVVKVNGTSIQPTPLVVGDTYCIWRPHQANIIPKSRSETGLSTTEAAAALKLFDSLVSDAGSFRMQMTPVTIIPNPTSWFTSTVRWVGKHTGTVLSGVAIAVITAILLTWLGLKP